MKTLDLRNLSESERDARINEAVAVHVAGWTVQRIYCGVDGSHSDRLVPPGGDLHRYVREEVWATSCDAVMPLLEKEFCWSRGSGGTVTVHRDDGDHNGDAISFPLAACIALLRANGVEVLT